MLLPPRAPHFDAALRDAREASPRGRAVAALVLAQPPPGRERDARLALAALVKDDQHDVRFAAMAGLGRIGDETVMTEIVAGIDDSDPMVREAAVIAVGRIGGPTAHAALRRAAGSEHGEVRFQVPPALLELCGEEARAELVVMLADERSTVRANAVRALRELDEHPPTLTRMRRMLEDADAEVRLEAALTLAEWGEVSAGPELAKSLDNNRLDDELAFAVLDAIGSLKYREGASACHQLATAMLRSRSSKAAAAAALARLGDPRGVPLLRGYLTSFRSDLRDYVLGVVGALGLVELEPEVLAFAAKPKGVELESIAAALEGLADVSERSRNTRDAVVSAGGELAKAITEHQRARAREARELENG